MPEAMGSRCPLCTGHDFVSHRFGLLRCGTCGLIVNPRIFDAAAADVLNDETFGDTYDPECSSWVRWHTARRYRRYLGYLRRTGVTAGELLEVGVGAGSFLRAARDAGFSVSGCDISESLCRRVVQATGILVHCASLETLPEKKWDVLVMNHVLEHVHDPVEFLRAAHERLRPLGVLHLAVPNAACWEAGLPGWNAYAKYHLSYFTPQTLKLALRQAGFAPELTVTHEDFSSWFPVVFRTLFGIRPASETRIAASLERVPHLRTLIKSPYRLAMVGTGALLWPLCRLQSALGYGDELICVVRKTS